MRDIDPFHIFEPVKGAFAHKGDPFREGRRLQTCGHIGVVGSIAAGAEDVAEPGDFRILEGRADEGQRDLCEVGAIGKRADADDELFAVRVGNDDGRQAGAAEGIFADVDERVGQDKIRDARIGKGITVNAEQRIVL